MRNITGIIVHCTATRPEWWEGRATADKVQEIRRWHVDQNGWSDIGYHYLIDRDGKIAEGRPMSRDGAHVRGHNRGTIGISLFGGHGSSENDAFSDNFTPEQDKALRGLIADLKRQYGDVPVTGHNEYAAKACPGFRVARWLERKPDRKMSDSSTLKATGLGATGVATVAGSAVGHLDGTAQVVLIVGAGIALLALAWIARERIKKWAQGVK